MTDEPRFRLGSILKQILPPLHKDDPFYHALLDELESESDDQSVLSQTENFGIVEDFVSERWLRRMQAALIQNSAADAAEKLLPNAEMGEGKPALNASNLASIGVDNGHVRASAIVEAQKSLEPIDEMIALRTARRLRNLRAKVARNQPADSTNDNQPLRGDLGTKKPRRSDGN